MSPGNKKRLLLVAHNFPPLASGGVHRPVKFARYLPAAGWDVDVLTVKDIRYHAYDPSLLDEIPNTTVYRTGSLELLRLLWLAGWRPAAPTAPAAEGFADLEGLARFYRGAVTRGGRLYKTVSQYLFQPDGSSYWIPFGIIRALVLLRRNRYDAVLTTSPPESCHLVGLAVKRLTGARWVADFRDSWSAHHLRRGLGPLLRFVNRKLETSVLKGADGVVANNDVMAAELRARGAAEKPVLTLPNGFDPADFGAPLAKARAADFAIVHNGSFRGGRSARALVEGFARARAADADFAARAKLYLMGINRDDDVRAAETLGLAGAAFFVGYVRHRDAMRACLGADLLALVMSGEEGGALVPGKVYEYLGAGRPILAAIPAGAARELLAGTTRAITVVPPDDAAAIGEGLRAIFAAPKVGKSEYALNRDKLAAYERPGQTARLSLFLDNLL